MIIINFLPWMGAWHSQGRQIYGLGAPPNIFNYINHSIYVDHVLLVIATHN